MVDPDIQRLLDTMFKAPSRPSAPDIAALRQATEEAPKLLGGEPEAVSSIDDVTVGTDTGHVVVRVYRPTAATSLPLLLFAHGGGWVTGSLDSHDKLCRILANRLPAVVVAVDYRRAPEHVFPAALDDYEEAWRWARANAKALGADGARFIVAGDSSGGNLAAALTQRLRANGAPQPDLQSTTAFASISICARTIPISSLPATAAPSLIRSMAIAASASRPGAMRRTREPSLRKT